jgi:hypothetical protein
VGADLYLEPEASYAAAQELARDQGEALPVASRTLHRRLRERGLLAGWDERRKRLTVRRTLEGVAAREVLHLRSDALSPCSEPSKPSISPTDPPIPPGKWTVPMDGPMDGNGHCGRNRPSEPSIKPAGNAADGRFGRSDTGGEAGQGAANAPTPPAGASLFFQDEAGRPCGPDACRWWTWAGAPRWYDTREHLPPI